MSKIGFFCNRFITLFMNNQSTICLAKNSMCHKRSEDIDVKYHCIREKMGDEKGVVRLFHFSKGEMVTDIVSKAFAIDAFKGVQPQLRKI